MRNSKNNDAVKNDSDIVLPPVKKYELRSSVVHFINDIKSAGMSFQSRQVLYFTDSGKMQCREVYLNDRKTNKEFLSTVVVLKEGYVYTYSPVEKKGTKEKSLKRSIAGNDMFQDIEKMKQDYPFKEADDEEVCGKMCKVVIVTTPSGDAKIATWNQVVLLTSFFDPKTKMSADMKANKIEENVEVAISKFDIPNDIAFTLRK